MAILARGYPLTRSYRRSAQVRNTVNGFSQFSVAEDRLYHPYEIRVEASKVRQ